MFGHWPVYPTPCKATAKKNSFSFYIQHLQKVDEAAPNGRTLSDYKRSHHGTEKPASSTK
jgi:hypothetical protein